MKTSVIVFTIFDELWSRTERGPLSFSPEFGANKRNQQTTPIYTNVREKTAFRENKYLQEMHA